MSIFHSAHVPFSFCLINTCSWSKSRARSVLYNRAWNLPMVIDDVEVKNQDMASDFFRGTRSILSHRGERYTSDPKKVLMLHRIANHTFAEPRRRPLHNKHAKRDPQNQRRTNCSLHVLMLRCLRRLGKDPPVPTESTTWVDANYTKSIEDMDWGCAWRQANFVESSGFRAN